MDFAHDENDEQTMFVARSRLPAGTLDLRVGEGFVNPLGFHDPTPTFSWKLPATGDVIAQKAFRVVAATSADKLPAAPDLWDSGRIESPQSTWLPYAGKPLAAGRISFEPDTDRGNKGPAGYGDIVAGRYETYRTMGVVGGPHRVVIEGYSGASPDEWRKRSPLFPPHITVVELPTETTSFDFDVPASPQPGRKRKDK